MEFIDYTCSCRVNSTTIVHTYVVVQVIVMDPVVMLMTSSSSRTPENNKTETCDQLIPPHTIQPIVIASGKFETQVIADHARPILAMVRIHQSAWIGHSYRPGILIFSFMIAF